MRVASITTVVLLAAGSAYGQAPVGTGSTYQGQLKQSGSPLNGSADMRFALWDVESGGTTPVAGPLVFDGQPSNGSPVNVVNGLFTLGLDFGAGVFSGSARWLEIAVRTPHDPANTADYVTLSPRQNLTPTPYALFALAGNRGPQGKRGPPGSAIPGGIREFAAVGAHTWVAPEGVDRVMVELWGGSGGGGQGSAECGEGGFGGGGGAAGYLRLSIGVIPGEAYVVRVGSGGNGGAGGAAGGAGAVGTDGTSTTFEAPDGTILAFAGGGQGGQGGGGAGGPDGAGGPGGSVSPLDGLVVRPGRDGGVGGTYLGGYTGAGTVSPPHAGDLSAGWLSYGSACLHGGAGGGGDVRGGGCGPGAPPQPGHPGYPGDHGYAVLTW